MILNLNNILQSQNKSRVQNSDSADRAPSGEKNPVQKADDFDDILREKEESKSRSQKKKTQPAADETLSVMNFIQGMGFNSQGYRAKLVKTGKDVHSSRKSGFAGLPAGKAKSGGGAVAADSEIDAPGMKSASKHKPQTRQDILKDISDLSAKLDAGPIKFEKTLKSARAEDVVERLMDLASEKDSVQSPFRINGSQDDGIGENHAVNNSKSLHSRLRKEITETDGENNNPLHNNVTEKSGKDSKEKLNSGEKNNSSDLTGDSHREFQGFYPGLRNQAQAPSGHSVKASALAGRGSYGPLNAGEFGRTVFNIIRNIPDDSVYSARLTLRPESLGTVFVEISLNENMAKINIRAESKESVQRIESQLSALKDKLGQQGIGVENIDVSLARPDKDPLGREGRNDSEQARREDQETRRQYAGSFRRLREDVDDIRQDFLKYVQD